MCREKPHSQAPLFVMRLRSALNPDVHFCTMFVGTMFVTFDVVFVVVVSLGVRPPHVFSFQSHVS